MTLNQVLAGVAATVVLAGTAVAQPYGMGPGMMSGYGGGYGGGYGMGPGMMGGYDRSPATMFGYSTEAYSGLDLTPEQQKSIVAIQEQANRSMWTHMGTMHGQGNHMQGMFGPGQFDESAARKSFQSMSEAQAAMFELQLDARKKIDAVLTKDQRDKLARYWSNR
jgi:Spy/CpxP family protein refolding chaperone